MRLRKSRTLPSRLLLVVLPGLLLSISIVMAGVSLNARAAFAATLTVTDCSGETGAGRIGSVINSASAGDTITFSCSGTIPISHTLVIGKNLMLDGSGQTVTLDGGNSILVLSVSSGVRFTLNALTIAHGFTTGLAEGGALINNGGTVNVSNSTFTGNASFYGSGAGLYNYSGGTVSISNSTFTNNSSGTAGGGILNFGTMNISNSTFTHNRAYGFGGGLFNNGGTVSISSSSFTNNKSTSGDGAGLYSEYGTISISNSTFSANSVVSGDGGGLYSFNPIGTTGKTTVNNSTFVNNSATNGGGLTENGTVSITNSTFASNSASRTGGGLFLSGTASIGGTIVATNNGGNCANNATITDQGYNLESSTDCNFTGMGDLQNSDPRFDPNGLQYNGGATGTLALQPASPAVDHIPQASICPSSDQRGVRRPQGSKCDIGAFEMTTADGLTVMVHVVNSVHFSKSIQVTLDGELQAALVAVNKSKTSVACASLDLFIGEVKLLTGHGITSSQATQLLNNAAVIKTRLGC